ncbi:hypothetical protein CUT44_27145 [Streptomyces carminius]|uniref:DUF7847 domain-containing protein n=1 Tax=Streptomyces carminius TaxID=2665496 RepID=A0A2M8LPZ1_9ACTN|nr:glycerophosphoryl diester phosphodiesterase membrane domain-containing protein [Streptomyces carminius]PJE94005.1 hypothetical protein CUT44_27145 [Streptomyces carminius]
MSDSPGWASPGSSPSDPPPSSGDGASGGGADGRPPVGKAPGAGAPGQQPPAAPQGWGAAPPPPPGQPGWGGQPGWDQWNQPPAAKPGVIPLRPLGVGEILDGAISTARAHWRTVLGIALGVAVMIQLASTVATGVWLRDNSGLQALETKTEPTMDDLREALNGMLSTLGVGMLATLIGTVLATAMLTVVVSRAVLGRPVSLGEAWRDSRPQLLRLLGLTLLVGLVVTGAIVLGTLPGVLLAFSGSTAGGTVLGLLGGFAGILVAVWLWVRYCLSAPALMLERQGVIAALRRSAKLVRNSWWRIFGIQLLTLVLVFIIGMIIELPASFLAPVLSGDGLDSFLTGTTAEMSWTYLTVIGIGAVLSSTVTLPLSAGVTALLYMDQRIRREALDLELARAAGVPGHGQQPSGGVPGNAPGT